MRTDDPGEKERQPQDANRTTPKNAQGSLDGSQNKNSLFVQARDRSPDMIPLNRTSLESGDLGSAYKNRQETDQQRTRGKGRVLRHVRATPLADLTLLTKAKRPTLTKSMAAEIRSLLPTRLQLHDSWSCIYNLDLHGVSLGTLFAKSEENRARAGETPGFLLVVQDTTGNVFGAFVNEFLRPSSGYYGNGECFLWKIISAPPSINQHNPGTLGESIRFKGFPWTGVNDYQIYCTHEFVSIGGGNGKYGLWFDDKLEKGLSQTCPAFNNEALSDAVSEGRTFDIVSVELWKL